MHGLERISTRLWYESCAKPWSTSSDGFPLWLWIRFTTVSLHYYSEKESVEEKNGITWNMVFLITAFKLVNQLKPCEVLKPMRRVHQRTSADGLPSWISKTILRKTLKTRWKNGILEGHHQGNDVFGAVTTASTVPRTSFRRMTKCSRYCQVTGLRHCHSLYVREWWHLIVCYLSVWYSDKGTRPRQVTFRHQTRTQWRGCYKTWPPQHRHSLDDDFQKLLVPEQ